MSQTEEWRPIAECSPYEISNQGRVRNMETQKLRKSVGKEYHQIALAVDKKRIYKQVHFLVAEAFIPLVSGKNQVNHINGIKKDNRVENLEWTNASDNRLHAIHVLGKIRPGRAVIQCDLEENEIARFISIKDATAILGMKRSAISAVCRGERKTAGGFIWKYEKEMKIVDLSDWKSVLDNENYMVSPRGEVYSKRTKEIMSPQTGEDGYVRIVLSIGYEKATMKYVHILVAESFIPKGGKNVVNHIDSDKSNNHVDNLEWTTQSGNISDAVKMGKIAKRIIQCDPVTHDPIKEYSSVTEASKNTDISRTSISSCSKRRTKNGR